MFTAEKKRILKNIYRRACNQRYITLKARKQRFSRAETKTINTCSKPKEARRNDQYLTFSGEEPSPSVSRSPQSPDQRNNTEKRTSNQDEARSPRTGQTVSTSVRRTRTPQEPPVQQPGEVRSPPPSIVCRGKGKGKAGDASGD
jgi:hypothetical protein